ncbi:unnamed protein product [Schistosoma mattheei]|uniref:Uncharacterized protein n=1 Tax=Schistosoma mattheei TaxID=31246 RepID=A0A3P8CUZ7_9TREM|nr:unnamed protein product [Schistosoma mattheei]
MINFTQCHFLFRRTLYSTCYQTRIAIRWFTIRLVGRGPTVRLRFIIIYTHGVPTVHFKRKFTFN